MKKFLSIVLALTMIVSMFTTTVSAATMKDFFESNGWSNPTYGEVALDVKVSARKSAGTTSYRSSTLRLADSGLTRGIGVDYQAKLDMAPVRDLVSTLLNRDFIDLVLADDDAKADLYAGTVTTDVTINITYPAAAVVEDGALDTAGSLDNAAYVENGSRSFSNDGDSKTATIKYKNVNGITVDTLINNPSSIFDDITFTLEDVIKYKTEGDHKVSISMLGSTRFSFANDAVATVTYSNNEDESFHIVSASIPTSDGGGGGGSSLSKCTIAFNTNGGNVLSNISVVRGEKAELPTPVRNGYIFEGWYVDAALTTPFDSDTKIEKTYTLYAKWSEKHECRGIEEDDCPCLDFIDLDPTLWYHTGVDYVLNNGMMIGVEINEFAPDEGVTRAMIVTVLWRAEGKPTAKTTGFEDLESGEYYVPAINWAVANGVVMGYSDTEFGPKDVITREQFAAILHRYAKNKGYDVSSAENTNILSYADYNTISEYAIPSLQYAVGSDLLQGRTDSTLNPLDETTRAEMATILHRFFTENK